MIDWLTKILLSIAGGIASLFVARDALKFDVVVMVIVVILFTFLVLIIAFWSTIRNWFKQQKK